MRIALAQMDMAWEEKEKNYEKSLSFLEKARKCGADLLLFPEMSMTGFSMDTEKIGEEAGNLETLEYFKGQAAKNRLHVGIGYVKKKGRLSYNCFSLLDSRGEVQLEYEKIHPFSYGKEAGFYQGGERLFCCQVKEFCVAPLICYDLRFPEVFQILSKKAQLIVVPANWPAVRQEHFELLIRARALENQCYVAGINRTGEGDGISYGGGSLAADPWGNVIARADDKEGLLCADLDLAAAEQYRTDFPVKKDRRDSLYMVLSKEGAQAAKRI